MGKRVSPGCLEQWDRTEYQGQRENLESEEKREMLVRVVPKVMQAKRVTLDHLLQELRENLENLVVQGKRVNQVSLVLKESQAYQAYQEQRVSEERQGLLEEVSEGSLELLDQRVTVETKETLEPWDQGAHLVKRGTKEPQRS